MWALISAPAALNWTVQLVDASGSCNRQGQWEQSVSVFHTLVAYDGAEGEVVSLSDSWTLSTLPLFLQAQCSISLEDSITLPEEAWFDQSGASDLPAGLQFLALPPTVLWKHNPTFSHLVSISSSMVHRILYIFLLHTLSTSLVALFLSCHFVFFFSEDVVAVRKKKEDPDAKMFLYFVSNDSEKGEKKTMTPVIWCIYHTWYMMHTGSKNGRIIMKVHNLSYHMVPNYLFNKTISLSTVLSVVLCCALGLQICSFCISATLYSEVYTSPFPVS